MVINSQRIKIGKLHAGKIVTSVIEDTHLRVMDGDEELAVRQRKTLGPITQLHVHAHRSRSAT